MTLASRNDFPNRNFYFNKLLPFVKGKKPFHATKYQILRNFLRNLSKIRKVRKREKPHVKTSSFKTLIFFEKNRRFPGFSLQNPPVLIRISSIIHSKRKSLPATRPTASLHARRFSNHLNCSNRSALLLQKLHRSQTPFHQKSPSQTRLFSQNLITPKRPLSPMPCPQKSCPSNTSFSPQTASIKKSFHPPKNHSVKSVVHPKSAILPKLRRPQSPFLQPRASRGQFGANRFILPISRNLSSCRTLRRFHVCSSTRFRENFNFFSKNLPGGACQKNSLC